MVSWPSAVLLIVSMVDFESVSIAAGGPPVRMAEPSSQGFANKQALGALPRAPAGKEQARRMRSVEHAAYAACAHML